MFELTFNSFIFRIAIIGVSWYLKPIKGEPATMSKYKVDIDRKFYIDYITSGRDGLSLIKIVNFQQNWRIVIVTIVHLFKTRSRCYGFKIIRVSYDVFFKLLRPRVVAP